MKNRFRFKIAFIALILFYSINCKPDENMTFFPLPMEGIPGNNGVDGSNGNSGSDGTAGADGNVPTYTVSVTVTGLNGTLSLHNNGGDALSVTTNTSHSFSTGLTSGSPYEVSVASKPGNQSCFVTNGSGIIEFANITGISVACYDSGSIAADFNAVDFGTTGFAAGNGYVVVECNCVNIAYGLSLSPSGKINMAGFATVGVQDAMTMWSFNANGSYGPFWPGVFYGTIGTIGYRGHAIAHDSSGRILVAGRGWNGTNFDMMLWRYHPDGQIDTSFGVDGVVTYAGAGNGDDEGYGVAVDSQGRILVVGDLYVDATNGIDLAVWRFNPDGTLDKSFNEYGSVPGLYTRHSVAGGKDDFGRGIALKNSGFIVATGFGGNASINTDMIVVHLQSTGAHSTQFSHHNAAGGNGFDYGYSIAVDSSGRAIVSGSSSRGGDYDLAVWRLHYNGAGLDTTFNSTGYVTHHSAAGALTSNDYGYGVTIDADGRILVTGESQGTNIDMVVWRFNPDGSLDTDFDSDGFFVHDNAGGGSGNDSGRGIVTDAQGNIFVSGYSNATQGNDAMALWKIRP